MEDAEIVGLFLARSEEAIGQTKAKYGARLRRLAYEITQDAQTAEECENEVYLRAWQAIPPHEPYGYLYSFLLRLTRNAALNECRSRDSLKRKAIVEALTDELAGTIPVPDNIEDELDGGALKESLNAFLATLPEEMRNVFVRRYWYMDSVARIAAGYGMTESKVASMLHRCRKKLKEYLQKEGYSI